MSVQIAVPLVCVVVSSFVAVASFVLSFRCCPSPQGPPGDEASFARAFAWQALPTSALVVILLFALTRKAMEPFSPGQGLGNGMLIGGLFAIVASTLRLKLQQRQLRSLVDAVFDASSAALSTLHVSAMWAAGELAMAIAPVACLLWRVQDDPTDALLGCAIGTLVVRFIVGFTGHGLGATRPSVPCAGLTDETLGVFHVALVVASTLAVMRDVDAGVARAGLAQRHLLWMLPLFASTIIAVIPLFTHRFITTANLENPTIRIGVVAVATSVLSGSALVWLTLQVYQSRPFLMPLILGVGTSLFLFALILSAHNLPSRQGPLGMLAALLIFGVWSECFRRLAGYGVALASVGVLSLAGLVVALSLTAETLAAADQRAYLAWGAIAQRMTTAIGLLVSVSLARIFLTIMHLRPAEISVFSNYLLTGLALGVMAPLLLLDTRAKSGSMDSAPTPHRLPREVLAAGMVGLAVFLLVVVTPLFFRVRSSAGMIIGLVVAQAVLLFIVFSGQFISHEPPGKWCLPPLSLFTLGSGLLVVQLGPHLADYTGVLQRPQKLGFTLGFLVIAFVWFVLAGRTPSAGDQQ